MKIINHSIVGSGLSALIRNQIKPKSVIYSLNQNKIIKSSRFYENLMVGGNSNIWGGYINFKIYSNFLKKKKFNNFHNKQKIFKLKKLFDNKKFLYTRYLSHYSNNKILRLKKTLFKNLIFSREIEKIIIKQNKIILHSKNKKMFTKELSLCIGNLSLIKLMYKSKMINLKDKVTYSDGKVSYGLNFFLNFKKNYYIPMTIIEIIEKLLFGKKTRYKKIIKQTLFVQKFSKQYKKYSYTIDEVLNSRTSFIRFFLSNHPTNLKINNIPINTYLKKYSRNINVYNSGALTKYLPGPISQNLIFNALRENEIK